MIPEFWLHETIQMPSLIKHFFYSLTGQEVQIISTGTWNPIEGPDFQDALIAVNGVRIRGDIEIHRTIDEWFRHGHHLDTRYHRVVLHILLKRPQHIPASLEQQCHHVLFPEMLTIPYSQWVLLMEHRSTHKPHYMRATTPKVPGLSQLVALSRQRFFRKARRIADWHHFFAPEDMLFIGIAEALGYPHNTRPLSRLMWEMPPSKLATVPNVLRHPVTLFQFLMYLSGLPAPALPPGQTDPWKLQGLFPVLKPHQWHFGGVRPNNRPRLRLASLATLLYLNAHTPGGLFAQLKADIEQRRPLAWLQKQWRGHLIRPMPPGLIHHLHTIQKLHPVPASTMGTQRFHQLTVNILLPLFYWWAVRSGSPGFAEYVQALYESYPLPAATRTLHRYIQHLQHQKPGLARALRRQAGVQQGLYEWLRLQAEPPVWSSVPGIIPK